MRQRIFDLSKQYSAAFPRALRRRAEFIATASKRECPVDMGDLRSSAHVVQPSPTTVIIGYGGPAGIGNQGETNPDAVGYAVYQHENLLYNHTVGKAKFLEDPMNAAIPTLAQDIANDVKKEVK